MADVDKALNTTTTVEVPKEEEVIAVQEQIKENVENKDNVAVTMDEEGGAEIEFNPSTVNPEGGQDHFENLAEYLEDKVLDPLATELMDKYQEYIEDYKKQMGIKEE